MSIIKLQMVFVDILIPLDTSASGGKKRKTLSSEI